MRKHLSIVTAAALTVGGMGLNTAWADSAANPNDPAAQSTPAQSTPANAAQRADEDAQTAAERAAAGQGLRGTAQAPDAEGIRDVLASSTEATFTEGGFDDLVERFVDADRNRIGENMPSDEELKPLNDQIKAFRDAWKNKYNQEFDIEDEELVFANYQIMQGEIGDQARTAGSRQGTDTGATGTVQKRDTTTVTVDTDRPDNTAERVGETTENAAERTGEAVRDAADATADAARNAADRAQQATGLDSPTNNASDRNLNDPGRNIATVQIEQSHQMPALSVNLIHEFPDSWRIDVPDTVDAAKLRMNLTNAVNDLSAMKDQLPADVNEAYRMVNHRVLAAIHDKQTSAGAGSTGHGASGAQGGGATGTGVTQ